MTRAPPRQLNLEVSLFLDASSYVNLVNEMLPDDYILIRNHEKNQEVIEEVLGDMEKQQGRVSQSGSQTKTRYESASDQL